MNKPGESSQDNWTYDKLKRYGQIVLLIYKGDMAIGQLQFDEDGKDAEMWIEILHSNNIKEVEL